MNIGLLFKIARVEKELTMKEVSELTSVTVATISEVENNKTNWKIETVKPLLKLYGYSLNLKQEKGE